MKNNHHKLSIYTIGYSNFEISKFIETLKKYQITAVADVRSVPFSKFKPDFNKDTLKLELNEHGIKYVFLGEYCGARIDDRSCYVDGKVDFSLVAKTEKFNEGLNRILQGAMEYNIVIMCAEKDPITCHRTILVSRKLHEKGLEINHIHHDSTLELHIDLESRLMKMFGLHQLDITMRSKEERLNDAYTRQGNKISFEPEDISKNSKLASNYI